MRREREEEGGRVEEGGVISFILLMSATPGTRPRWDLGGAGTLGIN